MSRVIEIPDETYAELTARAKAQGLSVEEFIAQLVEQAASSGEQAFWEELRTKGLLITWPTPTEPLPERFDPIQVRPGSKRASDIILEDRR